MEVYWTQIEDLCNRMWIMCIEYDYWYEAFDNRLGWLLAYIKEKLSDKTVYIYKKNVYNCNGGVK